MKKFETIEHTADLGIAVFGENEKELFENAAFGMFSQITDIKKIKEKEKILLEIKANNKEELLISWLNELQYYYSVKKILFRKFVIEELRNDFLKGTASGEKIKEHKILHDIKAATYHNLKIERTKNNYKTQIIFDV